MKRSSLPRADLLRKKQLAKLLDINDAELAVTLAILADSLTGRGIALVETATEAELRTAPDASAIVKKLRESELARPREGKYGDARRHRVSDRRDARRD